MSIFITLLNKPYPIDELHSLIQDSFAERSEQELFFKCLNFSTTDLKEYFEDAIIIAAVDQHSKKILGIQSVFVKKKDNTTYGDNGILAISPEYKGQGIASCLFEKEKSILVEHKAEFIIADTALNAKSSVSWHIKNGFLPITIRSFGSTNYYSIIFRQQLKYHWFWSNRYICKLHYSISSHLYKNIRDEKGNLKGIGKIIGILRKQD